MSEPDAWRKWKIGLGAAGVLALAWGAFEAGRASAGYFIVSSMLERLELRKRNQALDEENESLRHRVSVAEVGQQVDRQAQEDAQRMMGELQAETARHLEQLRDELWGRLAAGVPDLVRHAAAAPHAPHILCFSVPGADSEALLMHLDLAGVAVSSGSACSTGAVEPSHVLVAMGVSRELALGAIRFSLGHQSTAADVERVAEVMPGVVSKVRKLAGVLGRA